MVFSTREISTNDGQPVEFYEFRYGDTIWRYTNADQDIIGLGVDDDMVPKDWTAIAISRGQIVQGGSAQNELELTCQLNMAIPDLFHEQKPSGRVFIWVYQNHYGDDDMVVTWVGSVGNAIKVDAASARLVCRSIGNSFDRNGLRLTWDRMCPHVVYGIGCYLDPADHAYPREIATLTGTNFTCTAHSEAEEGSFTGGYLEFIRADGSLETLAILQQTGNDFQVLGNTRALEVGMDIILHPGCPRNTAGCKLFNNLPNYGGFPHMPGKSPFDGSPVF